MSREVRHLSPALEFRIRWFPYPSPYPFPSPDPFPFPYSVASLFGEMGFTLVDPPPHLFRCDNSQETGVAVPDRLFDSPQLEEISPDPAVTDWY